MAEIFRSKEIYKHMRDADNNSKIVPVRSIWVSGDLRTPVYTDHCCTILSMNSTTPNVGDYTTSTENPVDYPGHLSIIKVDANSNDQVVRWYTTASTDQTDHPGHLNIIKVDANSNDQNITWYQSSTENPVDYPGHLSIIKVDVPSSRPSIVMYDNIVDDVGRDCCVIISEMSSSEPVIVDS